MCHPSPFAPYARTPRTGRIAGPSRIPPVRVSTEASVVPRRYLRRHPDVTGEPPLFEVARSSPSRLTPPLPPLHRARHGRHLASCRPARPFSHCVREHHPRDRQHRPGSRIARCCAPLARTAARHRRPPPHTLAGDPSAPTSATTGP
jgi:hypothetical protein